MYIPAVIKNNLSIVILLSVVIGVGYIIHQNTQNDELAKFRALPQEEQYKKLEYIIQENGVKNAYAFLKSAYTGSNDERLGVVVFFALFLGEKLYEIYGIDGLAFCDPSFHAGCYVGIIKSFMAEYGGDNLDGAVTTVLNVCAARGMTTNKLRRWCAHGIGHGFALPEKFDVGPALADCDTFFPVHKEDAATCREGVFQEYRINVPENLLRPRDLGYPCTELADTHKYECIHHQPDLWHYRFGFNAAQNISSCRDFEDYRMKYNCLLGAGNYIGRESGGGYAYIKDGCQNIIDDVEAYAYCVVSAVEKIRSQKYARWKETASILCTEINAAFQKLCNDTIYLPLGSELYSPVEKLSE